MKRILYIVLAVCLCGFLVFLIRNNSRNPQIVGVAAIQDIDTQNMLTVSMDKSLIYNPIIGNGIGQFYRIYRFHNKTEQKLEISWSTWIELSVDGVWYKLSAPKSNASALLASTWGIDPGDITEYEGDYLSGWRSQLKPGKYRRVWTVYFDTDETPFYVAVEFTVM